MMHLHHSPAMRLFSKLSWLLTAIAAIAWGLMALGHSMSKNWNIWEQDFIVHHFAWAVQPLQYIIGIAGLFSLICWFMCLGKCDAHKHK